jgi:16S rRNA (cytosine967-C5)-methyltransferase
VERLVPVGDAPNWTARAQGLKRWTGGRPVNADPWRLFPAWLRDEMAVPPGEATLKARRLDCLAALQAHPPLWVGVRSQEAKTVWAELRDAGLKPWVHRKITSAAKLPAATNLTPIASFRSGRLVKHDLAAQAVALACDPDPGERWWDARGEADGGLAALQLAALMNGKGVVVSTFQRESQRRATALHLRRSAFHNITTKVWDGRHPPGKPASFDGVVLEAPCSGAGSWRRHPDARWTVSARDLPDLAARQLQLLGAASAGVRAGGTLVYTVSTLTRCETAGVLDAFLQSHPEYRLQGFPHPLEDATTGGTLQIWPQVWDCDGRFIARMTRLTKLEPRDELKE